MYTILYSIHIFFQVYFILLLVRIVGSWIPELRRFRVMDYINRVTDPYLNVFRSIIPPFGGLDFSPLLAFFALYLLENGIIRLILLLFG